MISSHRELAATTARTLVEVVPAVNRTLRQLTAARTQHTVTIPQYRVLVQLKDHPDGSLKDLADREGVEPPTMSRTVDALVERGLVSRRSDAVDRRCVRLGLRSEGEDLVGQVRSDLAAALETALSDWDPASLENLLQALGRLRSSSLVPRPTEASRE